MGNIGYMSIFPKTNMTNIADGSTWQIMNGSSDSGNASLNLIRNSNNNYWTVTASNLQSTIDDLTDRDTVWLTGIRS
jgi:hypothetical protein